jgi:hypothetical protein
MMLLLLAAAAAVARCCCCCCCCNQEPGAEPATSTCQWLVARPWHVALQLRLRPVVAQLLAAADLLLPRLPRLLYNIQLPSCTPSTGWAVGIPNSSGVSTFGGHDHRARGCPRTPWRRVHPCVALCFVPFVVPKCLTQVVTTVPKLPLVRRVWHPRLAFPLQLPNPPAPNGYLVVVYVR